MISIDIIYLSINALLFIGTFVYTLRKRGVDIVSFIFLIYSVLSVFSFILYVHPLSQKFYHGLNIWGFVLLYLGLLCFVLPLKTIKKTDHIIPPKPWLFHSIIVLFFLLSLSRLPSAISNLGTGVLGMVLDPTGFEDAYRERMDSFVGGSSLGNRSISLFSIAYAVVGDTAIFLYMYYQTLHYRKKVFSIALIIASLVLLVSYISDAERGGIARVIFIFFFSYLLFKDKFSSVLKNRVRITLLSVFIFLGLFLVAITASRFTNKSYYSDDYWSYSIVSYLGQPMLNYDKFVVTELGTRNGDRTAALVKTILQPSGGPYNYAHRVSKYSSMSIDESSFSTFLGDLSLDYGVLLTLFICFFVAFTTPFYRSKNGRRPFKKYIMAYVLLVITCCGWHLFPFSDVGGNLKLLFNFMLFIVI